MPRSRRKTFQKSLKKNKLPILLVLVGALLILFPVLYKQSGGQVVGLIKKQPVSENTALSKQEKNPIKVDPALLSDKMPSQPPQRIVVPSYKLDLPIVEANVVNGFWETSEVSASHGVGSSNPGENGNIVVFAHARDDLFGPLRDIKKGQKIYLLTKDRWHSYEVQETKLVNPEDVEVVANTNKETVTLFTCSGFLDTKRLIVKATPVI